MTKYVFMLCLLTATKTIKTFSQEQVPIQTDRPDQTECPFIVPKKYFQMENGISFEKTNNLTNTFFHPSSLIKYGLNDRLELRLIVELTTITWEEKRTTGINPVTVGFKINFLQEKGMLPTTSFIGHLTIPYVATSKFKSAIYEPAFRFTMQHTLTKRLSLGYNLGMEWEDKMHAFIYTITNGYAISEKAGAYVELYGFAPPKEKPDHRFDGGFNYLLDPNILLDVSGGVGISSGSPKYYIALGFSFRFKS